MLISIVLTLRPTQAATLPANLGRATHAWFLDQVRAADPRLAETLHAPNQERPFTVSNLRGMGPPQGGGSRGGIPIPPLPTPRQIVLAPEETPWLRVTSFSPELSALLVERLLAEPPERVALSGVSLRVVETTADGARHRWAGQTTFEDLVQRHTLGAERPAPRLALRFASPTVFRSGGANLPLPLPGLVFESLARRWNAFGPLRVPAEVRRFADEVMLIARYRLRTERVMFGEEGERGAFPGFLGVCGYAFRNRDRYWLGLIHTLAAFALYAGVGTRTTVGLGQARVVG